MYCYFQNEESPEITYNVVDTLQAMKPTLPIPSKPELDRLFSEKTPNKAAMFELREEKKWLIYFCKKKYFRRTYQENTTDWSQSPESYIGRIKMLIGDEQENTKLFDSLMTDLQT